MNRQYINEWLDDEKEDLKKTADSIKEEYAKDAQRVCHCIISKYLLFCATALLATVPNGGVFFTGKKNEMKK